MNIPAQNLSAFQMGRQTHIAIFVKWAASMLIKFRELWTTYLKTAYVVS
jgi:hypothetical protein